MFIDSHCHLDRIDLDGFSNGLPGLLENASRAGVESMLCIGIDLDSFDNMMQTIEPYPQVFASVGVHPGYQESREPTVDELVRRAEHDKIVAIGETGLDYLDDGEDFEWQRSRFKTHIHAAKICRKPLIIHTRGAREDTIQILREEQAAEVGGVMHCFTEDFAMAQQAMELGFYISISGIVTFKQAENVREMAKQIPDDRLLIETDSPWLAPVPFRGKINHPALVPYVAEKLAEIRDTSVEHIAQISRDNTQRLFAMES